MRTLKIAALCALAALVVAGHVALWTSPDWSGAAKLRLTILNALGWAVVFGPAWLVGRWAAAHRRPRAAPDEPDATSRRNGSGGGAFDEDMPT